MRDRGYDDDDDHQNKNGTNSDDYFHLIILDHLDDLKRAQESF